MASSGYITGRKPYARPQAMLWSNNPGVAQDGIWVPNGNEKEDFIICSDHNRSEINISPQRIETRQRMINGTMRSYYIGDKNNVSTSWTRLPSRSFSRNINFNSTTGKPSGMLKADSEYTVDGGAGGVELLSWYQSHPGPFWVYFAYDKYDQFKEDGQITNNSFFNLNIYNEVKLMYFSSFEYTIEKRGARIDEGTNAVIGHDFWNVSVSLEEA